MGAWFFGTWSIKLCPIFVLELDTVEFEQTRIERVLIDPKHSFVVVVAPCRVHPVSFAVDVFNDSKTCPYVTLITHFATS